MTRLALFVIIISMNSLWITRMYEYKNTPLALETAKKIIELKISHQSALLKKYKVSIVEKNMSEVLKIEDLFLIEARAAKTFWKEFAILLPAYKFKSRKPHNDDIVNKLLDVGYHHLTRIVGKILNGRNVSPEIAFMHVARTADSEPLVYDLMEMFRSDLIESEVLRFLRLKKKSLLTLEQRDIAHFLHEVNERCEKRYFLKDFGHCHTYKYYMEVQILKVIKAVNHETIFEPIKLPTRHDSRCRR